MRIGFAGGVDEVGSLGVWVEAADKKVLFDYGITPSKPPKFPVRVPEMDGLFLTHSHLDHVGMSPWICGEYGTKVYGTPLTLETTIILLEDTIKIAKQEGYPIPFDSMDVKRFSEYSNPITYGKRTTIGPLSVVPYDAGHIPGSAMYRFDEGGKKVLFTGDINTIPTRLQKAAVPQKCDILVMESTYAGRPHPERSEVETAFLDKVDQVLDSGGQVIIPAFAVGRTQEIVMVLNALRDERWLHGMGVRVSKLYQRYSDYVSEPGLLNRALSRMRFVTNPQHRKRAKEAPIIVTTSGMLDGGPVLDYIEAAKGDDSSAILLTGYQVEDTNGRMLMETGSIEIGGVIEEVNCEVCYFDFSAHAGHDDLVSFARSTGASEVILVHGDDRGALVDDLSEFCDVHTPGQSEVFEY